MESKQSDKAISVLTEVEALCAAQFEEGHPDVASSRTLLAQALAQSGRHADAVGLLHTALASLGVNVHDASFHDSINRYRLEDLSEELSPVKFQLNVSGHLNASVEEVGTPVRPSYLDESESEKESVAGSSVERWSPLKLSRLPTSGGRSYGVTSYGVAGKDTAAQFAGAGVLFASPTTGCDTHACISDAQAAEIVSVLQRLLAVTEAQQSSVPCRCVPSSSDACFHAGENICTSVCGHLERAFGSRHPASTDALFEFALWCERHGRVDDSLRLHLCVLDRRRKLLGSDDPDYFSSLFHVGVLYATKGSREDAVAALTQATTGLSGEYGQQDADVAVAIWQQGRAIAFVPSTDKEDALEGRSSPTASILSSPSTTGSASAYDCVVSSSSQVHLPSWALRDS
jgi:hypothetical protein